MSSTMQEMKKWVCHKKVHAEKIVKIVRDGESENRESDGSLKLFFGDYPMEDAFRVDYQWAHRYKPEVGGYYVVYEDGYSSYSPAKAFEEGYTQI
jgi:hypothetical protein